MNPSILIGQKKTFKMFILHSKTHGYLKGVTEEGIVYTELREHALVFGMMYQVAIFFTTVGKDNLADDLLAEPLHKVTYH
jgi:hypothetical protein